MLLWPVMCITIRSAEQFCTATLFFRGEFWFEKLRNTELRERAGEEQGRNYVTHEHDEHKKEYVEDDDD